MFADQTIDFSVTPVCPECGREILTGGINVEKDSIRCSTCGREMSFVEVMDYSFVLSKRNEQLPIGFSILSDSGSSLTISFKSVRTGLRLFGVIFSILLAVPIPWTIYHLLAGHCVSNLFAVGFVIVLATLEILTLLGLRNEWKLHMVFRFSPGCCSVSILPTFFKPRVREFTFDRETTFAPAPGAMNLLSPHRDPEVIILPFPMSGEQLFYLYSLFVDFKYGIRAGSFQVGEPDPARKSPMTKYIPPSKRVLRWVWCLLVLVILAIRIAISIYEFLSDKH